MKGTETHPSVHISHWHDALVELEKLKNSNLRAKTITIIYGGHSPSPSHKKTLIEAVKQEKIVAAQAKAFELRVLGALGAKPQQLHNRLIPCITSSISVFQAQPVFDYLGVIKRELGNNASPSDISVILNRLGLSSIEIPLERSHFLLETFPQLESKSRFPRTWDAYMEHVTGDWQRFRADPFFELEDCLAYSDSPRVLLDFTSLEPILNGTARNAIDILYQLELQLSLGDLKWDATAIIPETAQSFFGLDFKNINIVNSSVSLEGHFHLGVSVTPIVSIHQDLFMGRRCAKWVVIHLDIIALRALEFLSQNTDLVQAVELYLQHADEVIFISEYARQDVIEYFRIEMTNLENYQVILEGNALKMGVASRPQLPPYVFVIGNDHPHKQVALAVENLTKAGYFVVSFSSKKQNKDLHQPISPGSLSEAELQGFLENAAALVFPSVYEGYGLPIAEAATLGKPLVLWDTEVSHEVSNSLGVSDINFFCKSMEELVAAVGEVFQHHDECNEQIRKLEDFNNDVLKRIEQHLSKPIDLEKLENRWKTLNNLDRAMNTAQSELIASYSQKHWKTRIKKLLRYKFG